MARGFIRGVFWGSCVSLGGIVLVSVFTERPGAVIVPESAADAEIARAPEETTAAPDTAQAPLAETQGAATTPLSLAPEPDTLAGLRADDMTPAAVPEAGDASALEKPASVAGAA